MGHVRGTIWAGSNKKCEHARGVNGGQWMELSSEGKYKPNISDAI